jgi:hypothetical protein
LNPVPSGTSISREAANPDALSCHREELIELMGVMSQFMVEPINPHLNLCRAQAKEDDSRERHPILKDEFAKVSIISDENPAIPLGENQNLLIRKAGSMVTSNGGDIMPKGIQMGGNPNVCVLIKEKFHTLVGCLPTRWSRSLTTV